MNKLEKTQILSMTFYDRQLAIRPLPRDNTDYWMCSFPNIPHLKIFWSIRSRHLVLRHAYQNPNIEIGGVLVGNVYRSTTSESPDDMPIDFILIIGAIPAPQSTAEVGRFNFTPDAWANINNQLDRSIKERQLPSDAKIIGWYHTHPGHGIFLSGQDLFIHENFFSQEFQFALVIETKENQGKFFVDSQRWKGPYPSNPFTWDVGYWVSKNRINNQPVMASTGVYRIPSPTPESQPNIIITDDELHGPSQPEEPFMRENMRAALPEHPPQDFSEKQVLLKSLLTIAVILLILVAMAWIIIDPADILSKIQIGKFINGRAIAIILSLILLVAVVLYIIAPYLFPNDNQSKTQKKRKDQEHGRNRNQYPK